MVEALKVKVGVAEICKIPVGNVAVESVTKTNESAAPGFKTSSPR
jgi:hypothetical protein